MSLDCELLLSWMPFGPVLQEVRYKVRDPKAHSKGGTLENTINTSRSSGGGGAPGDDAPPTMHPLHPGKVKLHS